MKNNYIHPDILEIHTEIDPEFAAFQIERKKHRELIINELHEQSSKNEILAVKAHLDKNCGEFYNYSELAKHLRIAANYLDGVCAS